MRGKWCPGGCETLIAQGMELCTSCSLALSRYIDENPSTVRSYADSGIAALEVSLANHAAFQAWLTTNERNQ